MDMGLDMEAVEAELVAAMNRLMSSVHDAAGANRWHISDWQVSFDGPEGPEREMRLHFSISAIPGRFGYRCRPLGDLDDLNALELGPARVAELCWQEMEDELDTQDLRARADRAQGTTVWLAED